VHLAVIHILYISMFVGTLDTEAVVQTQHFMGYVERIRSEYQERATTRQFIRDWITFRLHMRALTRRRLKAATRHSRQRGGGAIKQT
jgi:hypothetical protein